MSTLEAQQLRAALGGTVSTLACRKAVSRFPGDLNRAAEWLTTGEWQFGQSVSWDQPALEALAAKISSDMRRTVSVCMQILKNCGGNEALARRKMAGLPALVPVSEKAQGYRIVDVRRFDGKTVAVAEQLGTEKPEDYARISAWIKERNYQDYRVETLVDLFDREIGFLDK